MVKTTDIILLGVAGFALFKLLQKPSNGERSGITIPPTASSPIFSVRIQGTDTEIEGSGSKTIRTEPFKELSGNITVPVKHISTFNATAPSGQRVTVSTQPVFRVKEIGLPTFSAFPDIAWSVSKKYLEKVKSSGLLF